MSNIQIILQPCQPIYRPGENITGHVVVDLSKPTKINRVCLEACGRASVRFYIRHNDKTDTYSDEIVYLNNHLTLWDKNSYGSQKEIPVGRSQYPFSITIPYNVPPSIKVSHGKIEYYVKAKLDIPWAIDKHSTIEFTVACPIDFNYFPQFLQPQTAYIEKTKFLSFTRTVYGTVGFLNIFYSWWCNHFRLPYLV